MLLFHFLYLWRPEPRLSKNRKSYCFDRLYCVFWITIAGWTYRTSLRCLSYKEGVRVFASLK